MCRSVARVLRRTSTITAAQLSISILHAVGILREAQSTAQRQMEAEEKKKGGNKAAAARAADFRRTVQQCAAQIQEILDHNQQIFNAVFTHRLR